MEFFFSPFLIAIVSIVGAFTYSIVRSLAQARIRELEVRERIALIERGLVPAPEKDPQGFDRAMRRYDRMRDLDDDWYPEARGPRRYRSAGVTLIGVGFGLMLMIGVAGGAVEAGIGVGGFLIVMGLAFFVNGWLNRFDPPPPRPASPSPNDPPRVG